jgi:hypothetical protein
MLGLRKCFSTQKRGVGRQRRRKRKVSFQMLAFRWYSSELRPQIQGVRAKLNGWIGGRDALAAAHAVMLANSVCAGPDAMMFA